MHRFSIAKSWWKIEKIKINMGLQYNVSEHQINNVTCFFTL